MDERTKVEVGIGLGRMPDSAMDAVWSGGLFDFTGQITAPKRDLRMEIKSVMNHRTGKKFLVSQLASVTATFLGQNLKQGRKAIPSYGDEAFCHLKCEDRNVVGSVFCNAGVIESVTVTKSGNASPRIVMRFIPCEVKLDGYNFLGHGVEVERAA